MDRVLINTNWLQGNSEAREARGLSKQSLMGETTYKWSKREEKKRKRKEKEKNLRDPRAQSKHTAQYMQCQCGWTTMGHPIMFLAMGSNQR